MREAKDLASTQFKSTARFFGRGNGPQNDSTPASAEAVESGFSPARLPIQEFVTPNPVVSAAVSSYLEKKANVGGNLLSALLAGHQNQH